MKMNKSYVDIIKFSDELFKFQYLQKIKYMITLIKPSNHLLIIQSKYPSKKTNRTSFIFLWSWDSPSSLVTLSIHSFRQGRYGFVFYGGFCQRMGVENSIRDKFLFVVLYVVKKKLYLNVLSRMLIVFSRQTLNHSNHPMSKEIN